MEIDKKEAAELMLQIAIGDYDSHLERIIQAARNRYQLLRDAEAAQTLATLEVNDVVKFDSKMRPQYLGGAQAVVVGFEGDKVKVRLLENRYRGRQGSGQGARFNAGASILTPTGRKDYTYDGDE